MAKTYQINPKKGIINKKDEKKINKSINNKKINKTTKNINEHILDTIILDKEIDFTKSNFNILGITWILLQHLQRNMKEAIIFI